MKYILTLLIVATTLLSYSQKTETTYLNYQLEKVRIKRKSYYTKTEKNINNEKIVQIRVTKTKRIIDESVYKSNDVKVFTVFYFNENQKKKTYYKNNSKNGIEEEYHINGHKISTAFFKDDLKNGMKKYYSETGFVIKTENYLNDELDGILLLINADGQIADSCNYSKGKKTGFQVSFHDNGDINSILNYVEGKAEGVELGYYESGEKRDSTFYKKDKIKGLKTVWFENGKIKELINYSEGKKQGELITYWESGDIKRKDVFKKNDFISGKCYSKSGEDTTYYMYEIMPTYPGGEAKLFEHLGKNVRYPQMARESGVKGKVYIQFVVEKDGFLSDFKIIRGIGAGCDKEALKALKKMPKWNPGYQDGNLVRVRYILPVNFSLR
jgi:protein TonB